MQSHTWPRRFPKMVPITIVFEGRGGAKGGAEAAVTAGVIVESGEVDSWSSFSGSWLVVVLGLSRSSRKEVLRRFLVVVVVVVIVGLVAQGEKQGRRNRRILVMVLKEAIGVLLDGTGVGLFSWLKNKERVLRGFRERERVDMCSVQVVMSDGALLMGGRVRERAGRREIAVGILVGIGVNEMTRGVIAVLDRKSVV